MKRLSLAIALATTVSLSAQNVDVAPASAVAARVRTEVAAASQDVRAFYGASGYEPVWTRKGAPTAQAQAMIALFERADAKGLLASDYDAGQWTARIGTLRSESGVATFDVAMTTALMQYVSDIRIGRVDPRDVGFDFDATSRKVYLPAAVAQIASASDATAVVSALEPQSASYRALLTALARYRRIAQDSREQAMLPAVAKLEAGQTWDALPLLAARLRLYGDLAQSDAVDTSRYEGAIVDAVKHFQARHGLAADGVIGRTTIAQLNVPAARRVEQIEWAIERTRWMPEEREGASIVVNIPEFRLHASDPQSGEELTMRVVVGKASGHRTPVFDGDVRHVVFRPYWSVPSSIQRNEIAPKLDRDASYLARNNYELVDDAGRAFGGNVDAGVVERVRNGSLRVRQKPGASNALGLVKFLFPNDNNVYLHSTPQQALFDRTRRDFSHGCIRVEDPVALAEWTLRRNESWTKEKIEAAINGQRDDVYVRVEQPVNVMILYATAVAREDGQVSFFEDIYGHDAQLAKILEPAQARAVVMMAAR